VHGNTKLTPEIVEEVAKLVEAGNYLTRAVDKIGVDRSTFTRWMEKGAKLPSSSLSLYRVLYEHVRRAEANFQNNAIHAWIECWKGHGHGDYKAIRDFLARRFPDEWGFQRGVLPVTGAMPVVDVTALVKEAWEERKRLLAGRTLEALPLPAGDAEPAS